MNFRAILSLTLIFAALGAINGAEGPSTANVHSPDGRVRIDFELDARGEPGIQVWYGESRVLKSQLGLDFHVTGPLQSGLRVVKTTRRSHDETYAIAVGKASSARDHHNELTVSLQERREPGRKFDLDLRAFDDGAAFRYRVPAQESLAEFTLMDENTVFAFNGDPVARYLPLANFTTPYEAYYRSGRISTIAKDVLVALPVLVPIEDRLWVALTEADLTDYAGAYLGRVDGNPSALEIRLSPLPADSAPPGSPASAKVVGTTPTATPWRVIMIANDPARLIESNLIFHLNPPCRLADTSWIRPGATAFPWWNHYVLEGVDFEPGVNTATMKHYIDFCADNGIPYHSLDGLDIAWYGGPIHPDGPTDVTTAAPSIEMPELIRYAESKGVRLRLWMHWKALAPQLEQAFRTYQDWGIEGVMIDFMDRDDQEMVRWYHEVAEKAAQHQLTVTWHGAYKPTGMERTWPNVLSYEAVLNQEYNKWDANGSRGTPPRHNLDAAFIRMLAGPLDYHQGAMRNVLPQGYHLRDVAPPVQVSRAHQLATYVIYQNHLPMLADYPQAYRDQPGFDFLTDVPANWDETRVMHAEMGSCLVIARRQGKRWYVGGMAADEARSLRLPLDFLGDGSYRVTLFTDDPVGDATALNTSRFETSKEATLDVDLRAAGGFAARLTPQP